MACLSSRFPQGTTISEPALRQVAQAEHALHDLGFRHVALDLGGYSPWLALR